MFKNKSAENIIVLDLNYKCKIICEIGHRA